MMKTYFGLFFIAFWGVVSTKANKKPNIIFILTDDQGSADVGYRNPTTPLLTPSIDKLAKQSIRLENYYVHPTCSPTRAALLTGRYAVNVGLSLAFIPGNPGGLDPSYKILPEHLKTLGYSNHLVGKWHLGNSMAKHHPLNRGFDTFYGLLGGGLNYITKQCGSGRFDWWRNWDPEYENVTHATDLLNEEALRIVKKHAEDPESPPFFLFLSHPAPHEPLQAPQRHQRLCDHVPNRRRRLQCAMVAGIDEGVGEISRLLEQHNLLDDTIIAFSTDNGGVPHGGALNYPLRGAKTTVYEGGVRAPGYIYAPNFFQNNDYDFKHLFHVTDFMPTFLSMIDSLSEKSSTKKKPRAKKNFLVGIDGIDQYEALSEVGTGPRTSVHIHRYPDQDSHAYRRGPWKIIVGHHFIPFFYSKVYNETVSGRLVEGGGIKDRVLELILDIMDWTMGAENTQFAQYLVWIILDSLDVGGIQNSNIARVDNDGFFQDIPKSDLEYWSKIHTDIYPTVSLFNLDEDPSESNNLATKHPEKVKELLKEAEEVIKGAPAQPRGDMADVNAPKGPQANTWKAILLSLGSHEEVVPFGIYLDDDFDVNKLQFVQAFLSARLNVIVIFLKVAAVLILPFIIGSILLCKCFKN